MVRGVNGLGLRVQSLGHRVSGGRLRCCRGVYGGY